MTALFLTPVAGMKCQAYKCTPIANPVVLVVSQTNDNISTRDKLGQVVSGLVTLCVTVGIQLGMPAIPQM